jgi:excisionase family DNA binding protein
MSNTAQVLRPKTVCLRLEISRSTLHRLVKAGELKTVKLSSRCVGILQADIEAYLERS